MKYIHQIIGLLIFIIILASCSMKAGNTVQLKLPLISDTIKLEGKKCKMVYGAGHGPLKVRYFNNGDTLNASSEYPACIVTNSKRLNREIAYYEQGYFTTKQLNSNKLNRIWRRNTKKL